MDLINQQHSFYPRLMLPKRFSLNIAIFWDFSLSFVNTTSNVLFLGARKKLN